MLLSLSLAKPASRLFVPSSNVCTYIACTFFAANAGTLPEELGNLTGLMALRLDENHLGGRLFGFLGCNGFEHVPYLRACAASRLD